MSSSSRVLRPRSHSGRSRRTAATAVGAATSRYIFQRQCEHIADIAHGLDAVLGKAGVDQFLAQPAELHVDVAIESLGGAAAGPVDQLIARQYSPGPLDKAVQQIELARGQR